MSSAARCVTGGFCIEGSGTDGSGTNGSRFSKGYGSGSGGGDGEWLGVIGVVGILSVDVGSSTSGGESSGSSKNRLSITWLISSMLSSSTFIVGSLASGGCGMPKGIMDEVRLATI